MNYEIERKFLVNVEKFNEIKSTLRFDTILQGKIIRNGDWSLRSRAKSWKGYITLKKNISSVVREEYEYDIPEEFAIQLLEVFWEYTINKTRYYYDMDDWFLWEIDVYSWDNDWLIVAEIELPCEEQVFNIPLFIEEEVTTDKKYRNSELAKHPYNTWYNKK